MPIPSAPRSAALGLLRRNPTVLRSPAFRLTSTKLSAISRSPATSIRSASTSSSPASPPPPGGSSMNYKRFALFGGVVLAGAYFYRDALSSATGIPIYTPTATGSTSASYSTVASSSSPSTAASSSVPSKRIIAVDSQNLYTGYIPADVPVSKETDSSGRKVVEMLSTEEVTRKLRRNEESYLVNRGRGVFRYDVVQIPSNDPIEDDHVEKIIEVPAPSGNADDAADWMFWGVFDGHSGWTTSAKLRQVLVGFVARELNATYKAGTDPKPESIDEAIKKAFLKLDHEIVHESVEKVFKNPSKLVAAETLAPALAGSCALLAFYESRSQQLRVAVTGDSRAILGRRNPSTGKWTATPLSVDQTGNNKDEEARLRKDHPDEQYVIHNGRVLGGLEPTRAFGDASYKWSWDVQRKLKEKFFGRTPPAKLKSPPYVTAEPVVTTTKIQPENGDFVVMATDGLWEMLTNEEVVGLVGRWMEEQEAAKKATGVTDQTPASNGKWFASWRGGKEAPAAGATTGGKGGKNELPVETPEEAAKANGQKAPIRVRQWGVKEEDERFVCTDKNVATHLVRNALGGKNEDMLCALLTLPSPYSRRYRDDLTVEVIFFGETERTGAVTVNEEATAQKLTPEDEAKEKAKEAKAAEVKPKL